MPNCTICGQPIGKLPNWLDDVEITFRCATCAENISHSPAPAFDDEDAPAAAEPDEKEKDDDEDDEEEEPDL